MKTQSYKLKTYSELSKLESFEDRFNYLKLGGIVGDSTFGFDRYINQKFYKSEEWRRVRNYVILRDNGCDLGVKGREILGEKILVHHMNPIDKDDIINSTEFLLNPEYLISITKNTHDAIHYGDDSSLKNKYVERKPNDMIPWKK